MQSTVTRQFHRLSAPEQVFRPDPADRELCADIPCLPSHPARRESHRKTRNREGTTSTTPRLTSAAIETIKAQHQIAQELRLPQYPPVHKQPKPLWLFAKSGQPAKASPISDCKPTQKTETGECPHILATIRDHVEISRATKLLPRTNMTRSPIALPPSPLNATSSSTTA